MTYHGIVRYEQCDQKCRICDSYIYEDARGWITCPGCETKGRVSK
jgi:hypothetical protein